MTGPKEWLFALSVASLALAPVVGASTRQVAISGIVNQCQNSTGCIPNWNHVVIVHVIDASDAPFQDARVEILQIRPATRGQATAQATLQTDRRGMTAFSLTPGDVYSLKISVPGFSTFETGSLTAEAGTTKVLTVMMRLPAIIN